MNNKKIWLTVLIAGILALIAALCIYKTTRTEEVEEIQEVQEEVEIPETPQIEGAAKQIDVKKDIKQEAENTKKIAPTKQANIKTQKVTKKIQNKAVQESSNQSAPQETKVEGEVSVTEQEKTVVVPLKFSSKNTYKYVYTPRRYSKK